MPDGQARLPRGRSRGVLERVATGVIAAIAFVLAAGAAIILFSFFFAAVAALSAVVMARVWWLRRKFRKAFAQATQKAAERQQAADGNVLDGEYVVVEKKKESRDTRES